VDLDAVTNLLVERAEPAFRRRQVIQAATRDLAEHWDEVTTLPKGLRAELERVAPLRELVLAEEQQSADGTVKARFLTVDGYPLETVLMRHGRGTATERRSVCLSSQSGCALACSFCATGTMGLGRSLRRGEILEQLLWAAGRARADAQPIGNVVMMGMGEPFQNYEEVLAFCRLANDPDGFGLGARNIAISTVGWVPGIDRLALEPLQVKLAVSLHAPDDELRGRMMPVNRRYPLAELMAACARYRERTRRRLFVEYLMLDGVNDAPAQAEALATLLNEHLRGGVHVNLIVYNATGSGLAASAEPAIRTFFQRLEGAGVPASVRRSKGTDIAAACGQLAVQGARENRAARRADRAAAGAEAG